MRSLLRSVGFVLVGASALPGQSWIWPAANAAVAGNAVLNAPFSIAPGNATTKTRFMVVLDPSSVPFPVGTTLTQIALRRDVSYASQAYGAVSGNLTVNIGATIVAPDQVQDVRFARLWDGIPTQVYNSNFVVPAAPAPGTSLPAFQVVIPFARSFVWHGGPLAIDLLFAPSAGSSTWRIDGFVRAEPAHGSSRAVGAGCAGSNGFAPYHYALPETTMPGAALALQLEGAALSAGPGSLQSFAFHLLGLSAANYHGSALPIDLGTFGAVPGCLLRMDPLVTSTVFVSNPSALFGRATVLVPLPANPGLSGMTLYSQWLQFDSGQSAALPLIASDAQAITLGGVMQPHVRHSACTLWKYGATGFDNDSGRMVPFDHGPVLRFN